MTEQDRRRADMFQHLVLSALWTIILCLFNQKGRAAIAFGDLYGNQGKEARDYRREKTYGGILEVHNGG